MATARKKVTKRKAVKAKSKPSIVKKAKMALTSARKTARKTAQKMVKTVTPKKEFAPKRKKISRHKLLTAEGWRRLMTGGKK